MLDGTDGARRPFWSDDSRSIAFFVGGQLMRVDVVNQAVQAICDLTAGFVGDGGGTWNQDGTVVFTTRDGLF